MIIDLHKFLAREKPCWEELEKYLDKIEADAAYRPTLKEIKRLHYLYQRTAGGLARLKTFAGEPEIRKYLESLVSRAYGQIHETRGRPYRFRPLKWFFGTFPRTFRRNAALFGLSLALMAAGFLFGAIVLAVDSDAKEVILPFPHLLIDPSERVEMEESVEEDRLEGAKTTFSAYLMTHNTRVSILLLAMGITFGIGTSLLLFYNGVILGAVGFDYIAAGEMKFLLGWLMPHGVIEIPAVIIAGQAGLLLAAALLKRGERKPLRDRLRDISPDLATLIGGVAVLLIWAGAVEAFLSQYHEPAIPYTAKIIFGAVEFIMLILFMAYSGQKSERGKRS